jgi:acetoacetyl-CoA synthetase
MATGFHRHWPITNRQIYKKHKQQAKLNLSSYADVYKSSIDIETFQDFWTEAFKFFGIGPDGENVHPGPALADNQMSLFPPPTFFPQAKLNIAKYMLRNDKNEEIAIRFVREGVPGVERVS